MSDHEDEFEDAIEGPITEMDTEATFDEDAELKKFDDEYDRQEILRQAQETEAQANEKEDESLEIVDDGHDRSIEEALKAKAEGNDFFREKKYDDAVEMYSKALYYCPLGEDHKEQMSVFYGNRSAAYASVEEHELVIADCSSALDLNPQYTKVLMRRCLAFEATEKFDEALADIKKVLDLDPAYPKGAATLSRVEKAHAEKLEKMKDEALGKLKDLGNSILGNFGMSLDNFKMQQDPSTGSWSINMK